MHRYPTRSQTAQGVQADEESPSRQGNNRGSVSVTPSRNRTTRPAPVDTTTAQDPSHDVNNLTIRNVNNNNRSNPETHGHRDQDNGQTTQAHTNMAGQQGGTTNPALPTSITISTVPTDGSVPVTITQSMPVHNGVSTTTGAAGSRYTGNQVMQSAMGAHYIPQPGAVPVTQQYTSAGQMTSGGGAAPQAPLIKRNLWKHLENITPFYGTAEDDISMWLKKWDVTMMQHGFSDEELKLGFTNKMRDRASTWYLEELPLGPNGTPLTMRQVLDHMRVKFHNDDTKAASKAIFEAWITRIGQGKLTLEQYYDVFLKKLRTFDRPTERECIDWFLKGLPEDLRRHMYYQRAAKTIGATLGDAFEATRRMANAMAETSRNSINAVDYDTEPSLSTQYLPPPPSYAPPSSVTYAQPPYSAPLPTPVYFATPVQQSEATQQLAQRLQVLEALAVSNEGRFGRVSSNLGGGTPAQGDASARWQDHRNERQDRPPQGCYYCGRTNHLQRDCRDKQRGLPRNGGRINLQPQPRKRERGNDTEDTDNRATRGYTAERERPPRPPYNEQRYQSSRADHQGAAVVTTPNNIPVRTASAATVPAPVVTQPVKEVRFEGCNIDTDYNMHEACTADLESPTHTVDSRGREPVLNLVAETHNADSLLGVAVGSVVEVGTASPEDADSDGDGSTVPSLWSTDSSDSGSGTSSDLPSLQSTDESDIHSDTSSIDSSGSSVPSLMSTDDSDQESRCNRVAGTPQRVQQSAVTDLSSQSTDVPGLLSDGETENGSAVGEATLPNDQFDRESTAPPSLLSSDSESDAESSDSSSISEQASSIHNVSQSASEGTSGLGRSGASTPPPELSTPVASETASSSVSDCEIDELSSTDSGSTYGNNSNATFSDDELERIRNVFGDDLPAFWAEWCQGELLNCPPVASRLLAEVQLNTEIASNISYPPIEDTPIHIELETEAHVAVHKRKTPSLIGCRINNTPLMALIDTGATLSLMSLQAARMAQLEGAIHEWEQGPIRTANNNSMDVVGALHVELKIGIATVPCRTLVVRGLSKDFIIGKDVLKVTGAHIDLARDVITFAGCPPMPFGDALPEVATVQISTEFEAWVTEDTHIMPYTTMAIPVVTDAIGIKGNFVLLLEREAELDLVNGFTVWNTVASGDSLQITVTNITGGAIVITRGTVLAQAEVLTAEEANFINPSTPSATPLSSPHHTVYTTCGPEKSDTVPEPAGKRPTDGPGFDPRARAFGENKLFAPEDIQLGDNLTPEEVRRVHELLYEYRDIFQENLEKPGMLRVPPFNIDLLPGAIQKQQPTYRKPEVLHQQINTSMHDKVSKGVAEPSNSPFPAQVLMVPKKDGKLRLCVDLRHLNSITVPVVLEMPRVDDMFDAVRGARYFSLADATWGYWQISLLKEDRHKAAYITRDGVFQPTTMDFGMRNAPAYWQRSMNTIFNGLLWKKCLIYIDDLLMYSVTFDEHLDSMRACFERCRRYNLKLRPTKCLFLRNKIPFLGHLVSGDGLEMDSKKVEAVVKMPQPTTAARLNSFICFAQYYREFVRNFADIVRPLRDLVLAPVYRWEAVHTDALNKLKKAIAEQVVLAHPYPDRSFVLECDASDYGISFILSQPDDKGKLRVVAFGSRSLTPTERNYCTTERECLAVIEGVKKYHIYLYGVPFKVITDHKALTWLSNHKDANGKLMRWALKLQEYQCEIVHRPGVKHINADALSRLVEEQPRHTITARPTLQPNSQPLSQPISVPNSQPILQPTVQPILQPSLHSVSIPTTRNSDISAHEVAVGDLDEESLAKAQWADPTLRPIISYLRDSKLPSNVKISKIVVAHAQHKELSCNILYNLWWPNNKRHWGDTRRQVVVPQSWRVKVLRECHDSMLTGGHLGFTKTHNKLRERYYWARMYSDCYDYVLACEACQRRKGNQPINAGSYEPIAASRPWEIVGMDIFGPLKPRTTKGNRYIVTFTDTLTRYVVGAALPDAGEDETAQALVTEVICKHGVMEKLLSDRGTNFVSHTLGEVYKLLNIKKINTTAWHPQGNGITERFNRPLADMLSIYVRDLKIDWDEALPFVLFAYNTSVHEATKFTPFFLLYAREANFPHELFLNRPIATPIGGHAAYAEELETRMKEALELAKANNAHVHHRTDVRTADSRKKVEYRVNQKVWLYVKPRTMPGEEELSAKLQMPWQGPFTVSKQVTPNVVALAGQHNRLGQNVHVNRLKPYRDDRPEVAPSLAEDDDFDPTKEAGIIVLNELGEAQGAPEEEAVIQDITAYRITPKGIEYNVVWEGGETTWSPEENVDQSIALEQFFHSRRNEPFLGLKIYLEKYNKLCNRKNYSYAVAVQQLCEAFAEFCEPTTELEAIVTKVKLLHGIPQVREFIEDFLYDFKDNTRRLARRPMNDVTMRLLERDRVASLKSAKPDKTNFKPTNTTVSADTTTGAAAQNTITSLQNAHSMKLRGSRTNSNDTDKDGKRGRHEVNMVDFIDGEPKPQPEPTYDAHGNVEFSTLDARFTALQLRLEGAGDQDRTRGLDAAPVIVDWDVEEHIIPGDDEFKQPRTIEGTTVMGHYGHPTPESLDFQVSRKRTFNVLTGEQSELPAEANNEKVRITSVHRELEVTEAEVLDVQQSPNLDPEIDKLIASQWSKCADCSRTVFEKVELAGWHNRLCGDCCVDWMRKRVLETTTARFQDGWQTDRKEIVWLLGWLGLYAQVHAWFKSRKYSTWGLDDSAKFVDRIDAGTWFSAHAELRSSVEWLEPEVKPIVQALHVPRMLWWLRKGHHCGYCHRAIDFERVVTVEAANYRGVNYRQLLCVTCFPLIRRAAHRIGVVLEVRASTPALAGQIGPDLDTGMEPPWVFELHQQRNRRVRLESAWVAHRANAHFNLVRMADALAVMRRTNTAWDFVNSMDITKQLVLADWLKVALVSKATIPCSTCRGSFYSYTFRGDRRNAESIIVTALAYHCPQCLIKASLCKRGKTAVRGCVKHSVIRGIITWAYEQANMLQELKVWALRKEGAAFRRIEYVTSHPEPEPNLDDEYTIASEEVNHTFEVRFAEQGVEVPVGLVSTFVRCMRELNKYCKFCKTVSRHEHGEYITLYPWAKKEEQFTWVCDLCYTAARVAISCYMKHHLFVRGKDNKLKVVATPYTYDTELRAIDYSLYQRMRDDMLGTYQAVGALGAGILDLGLDL